MVKKHGKPNDLIDRVKGDPFFESIVDELDELLDPRTFIGRAPQQVDKFLEVEVKETLKPFETTGELGGPQGAELHV